MHFPRERTCLLWGPAGTGKSRLGLQIAADLVDEFKDGAYFVDLSPVNDPEQVASVIVNALSIIDASDELRNHIEMAKAYLAKKHMLLLLDNFEQVVQAAQNVADLLSACPDLKVLVTSREPLHIRGEREYPVPPLDLPEAGSVPAIERLTHYDAVRLFIDRAVAR